MKFIPLTVGILLLSPLALRAEPAAAITSATATTIAKIGTITDPSGDCRIDGNADRLTIAIPGSDHALDVENNRMNAPRVLQEVTGDFTIEVKVSGDYPENTETIVQNRRPFQGAGILVLVAPDTYARLERAQVKVEGKGEVRHYTYPSWELRLSGKPTRYANVGDGTLTGAITNLRLSRKGNSLIGAVKEAGSEWKELDPLTLELPKTIQVGLSASHNTTTPFAAVYENFSLTPSTAKEQ